MSYTTLAGGAKFDDAVQLPDFLWMREGNIQKIYDDGSGMPNVTIGIGLNLYKSPDNIAVVLDRMSYGVNNVFAAAATQGFSANHVVSKFEALINSSPLSSTTNDAFERQPSHPAPKLRRNVRPVTRKQVLGSLGPDERLKFLSAFVRPYATVSSWHTAERP
jgi:hypothetical protein